MARYRKLIVALVPIVGTIVVFLGVVLIPDFNLELRIGVVLVGVLLIEAGVWNLPHKVLPTDRKYWGLRKEVDDFIVLMRQLNEAAVHRGGADGEEVDRFTEILGQMHASVDRMAALAGQAPDEGAA